MSDLAPTALDVDDSIARAQAARRDGRPRQALATLLDLLERDASHAAGRLELALALEDIGRDIESRAVLTTLARDGIDSAELWARTGRHLLNAGHLAAAEPCLRRALALAPTAAPRFDLALLLASQGDAEGAAECFRALPTSAEALIGLSRAMIAAGRLDQAEAALRVALALAPAMIDARLARRELALKRGDLVAAWRDAACRWGEQGPPPMPGEAWDGGDCAGRTLLLFAEGWLDDTLWHLRFIAPVTARGARVILAVPPTLVPPLSFCPGIEAVLALGQVLPEGLEIDFHAALADLPGLLGLGLDQLPPPVLLAPPADRHRAVVAPPAALLKVGLAWVGERLRHQIPFQELFPLLALPQAACFSVQTGPRAQDSTAQAHPCLISDLAPTIADFADLAARIAEMDLVIAADSLAAHLAAALGKEVWLLLAADADPRWLTERSDSPWYPRLRLFRQSKPGQWSAPVAAAGQALTERLRDLGARRGGIESAPMIERALLIAHLEDGDLLLDIGPGTGDLAREAAGRGARVLAVEAHRATALALSREFETVIAAAGSGPGYALVAAKGWRHGRRVFPLPDWRRDGVPIQAADDLLAARPDLAERRLVVRLGAQGCEAAVLRGLQRTLARSRVAALVFTHHGDDSATALLTEAGYRLVRLDAGTAQPFVGETGPVLALAPAIALSDRYDTSPAYRASAEAARLAAQAAERQLAGDFAEAARLCALALAADPTHAEANANLGVALRQTGRPDAAIAFARRALATSEAAPLWSNLGNALREAGRLDEAQQAQMQALTRDPDSPDLLYNMALVERDCGRSRRARALLERSLAARPDPARRRDLALAMLATGALAEGFALLAEDRPANATPPVWRGEDCPGATMLVRAGNDLIDTLCLARFLPPLARRGVLTTLECAPELIRLLRQMPGLEAVVATGEPIPQCDFQVALTDLPHWLGVTAEAPPAMPVLSPPEETRPPPRQTSALRVGLVWAGRPDPQAPLLEDLLTLAALPGVALVSLQSGQQAADLTARGAASYVADARHGSTDFAELAAEIVGLDVVVGADSPELHLAAAMAKPAWLLAPPATDWRWPEGRETTPWYPSMRLFPQASNGTWGRALARLADALAALAAAHRG